MPFGYGRLAYESFDLVKVAEDAAEYARFQLLLSAANLISGATQKLLAENAQAG